MRALEARDQRYLFKLRLSKNVKRHIERLFRVSGWSDAGQGWEGIDSTLVLTGREAKRRVVVLRRPLHREVLVSQEEDGQQLLGFIEADRQTGKRFTGYEYAVLVTNLDHEILSLGQIYRDRADAENGCTSSTSPTRSPSATRSTPSAPCADRVSQSLPSSGTSFARRWTC